MNSELRLTVPTELRLMERGNDQLPLITGYAVVYNTLSMELPNRSGNFREVIRPGAFADSLVSGEDVFARFEHRDVIGRVGNGTLRLFQDARGVRYEIDPADTTAGRDAVTLIRRGDVRGSSFGFAVLPGGESWRRESSGQIREITKAKLLEISPVANPAYTAASTSINGTGTEPAGQLSLLKMKLQIAERE
ncbi:MAG: HK97 family phage prohead protease [Pirellulaceae bacterium]